MLLAEPDDAILQGLRVRVWTRNETEKKIREYGDRGCSKGIPVLLSLLTLGVRGNNLLGLSLFLILLSETPAGESLAETLGSCDLAVHADKHQRAILR